MEKQTDTLDMLELMTAPAFSVKDGKVHRTNTAAKQLLLAEGTALDTLLGQQLAAYQAFDGGCLFVTVHLGELTADATVNRIGQDDIFIIDRQAQTELRIMSLVAQYLRLPLADVISLTDRLMPSLETDANDQQKRQIAQVNRKLTQMHRIMLNMADAVRYTEDGFPRLVLQDAVSVVEEILERAQALLENTSVKLDIQLPTDCIACQIDAEKLERAIYNLLSNAVKASAPDSTVQIRLWQKKDWLYFSVQDAGSGISANVMANIFTRYQRSPGLEDARAGLGLGMVLVRAAAAAHGGTVMIQQPPEGGSRITMSFPIRSKGMLPLRFTSLLPDYAGDRDHGLLELSEVLPPELYSYKN